MNNLLDVRKMEEGKLILRRDPFSLQQLVENTKQMALPTLYPGVAFHLNVETVSGQNDWVRGDEPRLQQILTNIVSNAIKYTKRGSVTVSVSWETQAPSENAERVDKESDCGANGSAVNIVRLECRDTGPGIPKEDQLYLFERFTQRGGAPGSGLGLAIAKQMVTLMSGSIQFDSDPTVAPGTTCTVRLPLPICDEPPSEDLGTVDQVDDLQPIQDALSILLVDDISMNRSMLKRRLQKGIAPNSAVTEAVNGEQALAICETQQFDVIVMDQYMEESGGVMVGTDAIYALRRQQIGGTVQRSLTLIIGCSGNDVDDKFLAAGADLVWKKPMPSNVEIIQQIRQGLRLKRRQSLARIVPTTNPTTA
jgi:CheY-like chemotaxis protein